MKIIVTLFLALVVSIVAGVFMAFLMAEFGEADRGYILVFFAVAIAVVVAVIAMLVAGTRTDPVRAIDRTAIALAILIAIVTALFSLNALSYGLDSTWMWREELLVLSIGASMGAVLLAQWLVFRVAARLGQPRPAAEPGRSA